MDWLPAAVRDPHGRSLAWTETSDPKGCLHTTETSGWPSYQDWTVNPHGTVMPVPNKTVVVHQHVPFTRASFSLRNEAGGVQTNTDFVFQFELIGTADPNGPGYYWPQADDTVLLALYDQVIHPLSAAFGIPLRAPTFQAYPASYGAASGTNNVRMSGSAFDTYSGWLGHQHVPENVHGDPGAFPWARMIRLAQERDDMPTIKEITDALLPAIRATVIDVLKNERLVRNQPLDEGAEEGPEYTTTGVLSNVEKDVDLIRRAQTEAAAVQAQILAAVTTNQPPTS